MWLRKDIRCFFGITRLFVDVSMCSIESSILITFLAVFWEILAGNTSSLWQVGGIQIQNQPQSPGSRPKLLHAHD